MMILFVYEWNTVFIIKQCYTSFYVELPFPTVWVTVARNDILQCFYSEMSYSPTIYASYVPK